MTLCLFDALRDRPSADCSCYQCAGENIEDGRRGHVQTRKSPGAAQCNVRGTTLSCVGESLCERSTAVQGGPTSAIRSWKEDGRWVNGQVPACIQCFQSDGQTLERNHHPDPVLTCDALGPRYGEVPSKLSLYLSHAPGIIPGTKLRSGTKLTSGAKLRSGDPKYMPVDPVFAQGVCFNEQRLHAYGTVREHEIKLKSRPQTASMARAHRVVHPAASPTFQEWMQVCVLGLEP